MSGSDATEERPDLGRPEISGQGPERIAVGLRLLRAPNPSPMTERGTNTYLLGEGRVTVIDPGPALPAHLAAILAALAPGEKVERILVTHAHHDHSALAPALARETGAPVLAFGGAKAGRSARMQDLATGLAGGGEGVDQDFAPHQTLADGQSVAVGDAPLTAFHLPGHFGNHLCFLWQGAVFSGDLVMGWASSLIAPPDGDLDDYLASLARLSGLAADRLYPGHGDPVADPATRIAELAAHRHARTAAIVEALAQAPANAAELAKLIYHDIPSALLPAAAQNVFAHLLSLMHEDRAICPGGPAFAQPFRLA